MYNKSVNDVKSAQSHVDHIVALDGVRGIAILLIIIYHYFALQVNPIPGSALAYITRPTVEFWRGVDLFFVLSGFLIGSILLKNRKAENFYKVFYIRRICRILPLYYVIIILLIVFQFMRPQSLAPLYEGAKPLWSYITFTQNFYMADAFGPYLVAVTWAVAIEVQFYLMIPFLVRNITIWTLVLIAILLITTAPVLRHLYGGMLSYVLPYCRADSLMSGILLAVLMYRFREKITRFERVINVLFGIILISIIVMTVKHIYSCDFLYILLFGSLILIAHFPKNYLARLALNNEILRWFGARSYAIFLIHDGMNAGLHAGLLGKSSPKYFGYGDIIISFAALTVTLILAEVSCRFFESKFVTYGKTYQYQS
jgi:peptidoglycan/LPS O-acetylase OafA/YrhL